MFVKDLPVSLEYQTPQEQQAQALGQPRPPGSGIHAIELLVVVAAALIALMAIWPAPHDRYDPRIAAAKTDLSGIAGAISQFQLDVGRLPTDAEGLAVLTQRDHAPPGSHPYLKSFPNDPWNQGYRYQLHADGINFTISSDGPDGVPATPDDIVFDSSAK